MHSLTRKRCLELLLTGELIDAETALEWGLINRVVPDGEHLEAAMDLAETIASKSPMAVQRGKEAFYEMVGMEYDEALEYSNEQFAALYDRRRERGHRGLPRGAPRRRRMAEIVSY